MNEEREPDVYDVIESQDAENAALNQTISWRVQDIAKLKDENAALKAENAALKAAYKPAVTLQSGDQHSKLSGSGFWFHLKDSITLGDLPSGTVLYIRETKP